MICKNCGATIEDGVKFCTKCGEPAAEAVQEATEVVQEASAEATDVKEVAGDSLTVIEINAATNELKKVADALCNSLRDFMDRIAQNSISVVVENNEAEAEEDFDAEKFMAELEAEISRIPELEAENSKIPDLVAKNSVLEARIKELEDQINGN